MWKTKLMNRGLWIAGVTAIVIGLIGGDLLWSYWLGAQGMVRTSLRDATSIEFDLQRLDQAIEGLGPTLKENRKTAAALEVEIEYLAADTKKMQNRQEIAQAEMRELREALRDEDAQTICIDGRQHSRATVEADLLRRLQTYDQARQQVDSRETLLAKRRQTLGNAIECIRDNEQQQIVLADLADGLNAELQLLEVATATGNFEFDEPKLASARQLATNISKRIETIRRLCDQESLQYQVPVNLDRRIAVQRFDEEFVAK